MKNVSVFACIALLSLASCGSDSTNRKADAKHLRGALGSVIYNGQSVFGATNSFFERPGTFRFGETPPGFVEGNSNVSCDNGQGTAVQEERERDFFFIPVRAEVTTTIFTHEDCQFLGAVSGSMALVEQDDVVELGGSRSAPDQHGYVLYGGGVEDYLLSITVYPQDESGEYMTREAVRGLAEWSITSETSTFLSVVDRRVDASGSLDYVANWSQGTNDQPLIVEEYFTSSELSVSGAFAYETDSCGRLEGEISTLSRLGYDANRVPIAGTLSVNQKVNDNTTEITFDANGNADFLFSDGSSVMLSRLEIETALTQPSC